MTTIVVVPQIGESITSVTFLEWSKQVGDDVRMGDILGELETDKSSVPVECPAKGVVLATLVEEGEIVEIGRPLAVIGAAGEEWTLPEPQAVASPTGQARDTRRAATHSDVRAAPSARKLASELGIDIGAVAATLGGKRATEARVREYASTIGAAVDGAPATDRSSTDDSVGAPGHLVKLSRIRTIVAERMALGARTIPQFSVSISIDAGPLMAARETAGTNGKKVSFTALLAWAVSRTIASHPMMNARYADGDQVRVYDECNVAIAVDTGDGLVAPVIHGSDNLSPPQISERLTEMVAKARDGKLAPDDQANATFTISNLGSHGAARFTPMVVPGQSAILGVGTILAVPAVADDGGVVVTQVFEATVAADHRVTDGAGATQFLASLKQTIETLQ